ncbi:OLC1v1019997C1 [Oldenlandia corymbosa var. corymbosa]|uniref:OLC1v1019997C1 n=1 Tax=Oldenlandia corymbosa var. corymbosa TaxID=529605 RepID=A0AAV1EFU0_OLDCO|nr:OLC1v1019997C1 [Oldenlandia corymbosa var. corymbosa]
MDPLTALRQYTIDNNLDKITRSGNEFRFGDDYLFPATAETAYRSKSGQHYTLESLVHFVTNQHLRHAEYFANARQLAISGVTLPDRKELLDYLTGRIESSSSIDVSAKVVYNTLRDLNAAPPGEADGEGQIYANDEKEIDPMVNPVKWIKSMERPLKDKEQILCCKNRDFYSVLTAATKRDEERQRAEALQRKDNLVAKSRIERGAEDVGLGLGFDGAQKTKLHLKGSKIGEGVPIILVPSAFSTLITMYNVKDFLEDGVFVPTDVKVNQKVVKSDCVTVQNKFSRDRAVTAYEVRDKPSALKPEDWDRVVAVFVLGKEWQFKDWPFKDHVEIFNKILGFYLRFEDDSVESAKVVKQWNVKIISISKNKRHQDRAAALEVWDRLEEFIRSRSR